MDSILGMWAEAGGVPFDVFLRDAPFMAHSIDESGFLLNVSTFWADRLGYEPYEMIGRPSTDFLSPDSRISAVTKHLPEFRRDGRISNVRYRFISKNGDVVPVIMSAASVPYRGGYRSLAIIFDNGIAARYDEINQQIQESIIELEAAAEKADEQTRKVLEDAAQRLLRIADDP